MMNRDTSRAGHLLVGHVGHMAKCVDHKNATRYWVIGSTIVC